MGVVADARESLRQGHDLAWTLPLVAALGTDGRRWSLCWVERCLRQLLPFTEVDDSVAVLDAIEGLHQYEGHTPSQEEVWDRSYEISWPRWEARVAVCHLYRAWWYSRFQSNNQFAIAQEWALHLMLEATGRPAEFWELVLKEYERVAAEAGSPLAPEAE